MIHELQHEDEDCGSAPIDAAPIIDIPNATGGLATVHISPTLDKSNLIIDDRCRCDSCVAGRACYRIVSDHFHELVEEFKTFSRSRETKAMQWKKLICIMFWILSINGLLVMTGAWQSTFTILFSALTALSMLFGIVGLLLWTISWCGADSD